MMYKLKLAQQKQKTELVKIFLISSKVIKHILCFYVNIES